MPKSPPPPHLLPRPEIAGDPGFVTLNVALAPFIKSYRKSLFAFEWISQDGQIKAPDALAPDQAALYRTARTAFETGGPLLQPVVGWGMLDCAEIGAGRDVVLTAYAFGVQHMPMYVPVTAKEKMKSMIASTSQGGNVLWYILIAVGLIAALSYAVSSTSRSGSTSYLSQGQAQAQATEILTYANHVKTAVAKLNLRGCTDAQLNFDNDVVAGYTNGSAPGDGSCDVFAQTGGALTWVTPGAEITASPWFYSGRAVVHQDSGFASSNSADDADLVMMLFDLSSTLCTEINDQLGITGVPVNDGSFGDNTKFQGAFAYAEDINGLPEGAQPTPCGAPSTAVNFCGKQAGCFKEEAGAERYVFFQVLKQR